MELPFPGDSLELMLSPLLKTQIRPVDEVLRCARNKDLSGAGRSANSCPDDDPHSAHLLRDSFTFSGVYADPDL
jgi:hypothetical protein